MTRFKGACFAAMLAATGISTAASAQYLGVEPGPVGVGVGFGHPYYYDDNAVVVTRSPRYRYWSPSREEACIQDRRDFAERRNFICR